MTINIGPQTVCRAHRDVGNLGPSVCWVKSGGRFDARRGGHVVIHEGRVIVSLPSGCGLLLPSACTTHENIPVGEGETRYSLTGYMAGNLVQHVDQGFRGQTEWGERDPEGYSAYKADELNRWARGVAMFKTVEELKELFVALEAK